MAEITRRSVLEEALEIQEAQLSRCSVNGLKLIPMAGMQEVFREQLEKCRILREMIQALQSEPVRKVMADWQKELMEGQRVEISKLDKVPPVNK